MAKGANRREIRCQCGSRRLDITHLVGEVTFEMKCKCGQLLEVHVTAATVTTTLKETAKAPGLAS